MKKAIILISVLLIGSVVYSQTYKVIVNTSNSTTTISKKDLSDFFLKKKTKWQNDDKVLPVDLPGNSGTRETFSKEVHNKSVNAVKSYWQQYVFAGKGTPPVEKKTDDEIIDFVARNSGAIGYVSSSASISGVKEVKITQ